METLIQQNVYDFYDVIGQSMEAGFFKSPNISWLNTGSGGWPNMIYNTHFQENKIDEFVAQHISAIKTKKAPSTWLVYDDDLGAKLAQQLKLAGMRKVFHWTGMGLTTNAPIENDLKEGAHIKVVENENELKDWLAIVNTALMTSKQIHHSIFSNLYAQPNFNLYLVYENNIPVATGLAFFSKTYCGIYMIATLNEYRKKGLGSAITKRCMNDAYQKGISNIVLQASGLGESIYQKMGFKKYCEFYIYWMLGKEFK